MKHKYIIWDLDGTLINGSKGVVNAVNDVLIAHRYPQLTEFQKHTLLTAPRIQDAFQHICLVSMEEAVKMSIEYRRVYIEKYLLAAHLFPGIEEALKKLELLGCKQAVVTNKQHDCAVKVCHHFGIDSFCNLIIGADSSKNTTKPDLLEQALTEWNVSDKKDVILVGDLPSDKAAAENVGIDFLGANWGFGFKNVAGYADTPDNLYALI